jgi:hypothetical protein
VGDDAGPPLLTPPQGAATIATSAKDRLLVVVSCICEPVNELDKVLGTREDNPRLPLSIQPRDCQLDTPAQGPTATELVVALRGDSPPMNEISSAETTVSHEEDGFATVAVNVRSTRSAATYPLSGDGSRGESGGMPAQKGG